MVRPGSARCPRSGSAELRAFASFDLTGREIAVDAVAAGEQIYAIQSATDRPLVYAKVSARKRSEALRTLLIWTSLLVGMLGLIYLAERAYARRPR